MEIYRVRATRDVKMDSGLLRKGEEADVDAVVARPLMAVQALVRIKAGGAPAAGLYDRRDMNAVEPREMREPGDVEIVGKRARRREGSGKTE